MKLTTGKRINTKPYSGGAVGHRSSAVTVPMKKIITYDIELEDLPKYLTRYTCYPKPTPELFFDSGIARGINPFLAPGEIIDSPVT